MLFIKRKYEKNLTKKKSTKQLKDILYIFLLFYFIFLLNGLPDKCKIKRHQS